MATVSIPIQLTSRELIQALEQLEPREAEKIVRHVQETLARRRTENLSQREAELLEEVYLPKRPGFQERFAALQSRQREFRLTPEEHSELLQMIDESEAFTVRRLEALSELARLRQTSVPNLMRQLGIKAPAVV